MKKKIIFILLIIVILFSLTFYNMKSNRKLSFIEQKVIDGVFFIEKIIYVPINFVKEGIDIYNEAKNLYNENRILKSELSDTSNNELIITNLKKEISNLKETLDLNNTLYNFNIINATIINRDVNYFYNYLIIDKGLNDNINVGDCVVNNLGLIGKIVSITNTTSTVKLLTSDEIINKISVKIGTQYGVLSGYNITNNTYSIEGIDNTDDINTLDIVTTSGLTDYFPSDIVIGNVYEIIKDEYDLNNIVLVTPSVNFNDINYVSVLNKE